MYKWKNGSVNCEDLKLCNALEIMNVSKGSEKAATTYSIQAF